jgi:hypothetical protein
LKQRQAETCPNPWSNTMTTLYDHAHPGTPSGGWGGGGAERQVRRATDLTPAPAADMPTTSATTARERLMAELDALDTDSCEMPVRHAVRNLRTNVRLALQTWHGASTALLLQQRLDKLRQVQGGGRPSDTLAAALDIGDKLLTIARSGETF